MKEPTTSKNKYRAEDYSTQSDDSSTSKSSDHDGSDDEWVDERPEKEKGLAAVNKVNSLLRTALYYRTYRLRRTGKDYTDEDAHRIKRCIKGAEEEMRSRLFNGTDPVTILNFLNSFQSSFDINGIQEGADLWKFQ